SAFALHVAGEVHFDARYVDALDGLVGFSHAWLLSWLAPFDRPAPDPELRQVPLLLREQPEEFGIFATRGPRRPNPIGLSLVRIVVIDAPVLQFAGVDLVDGTILLDVKPYVTRFDQPSGEIRCGWFDARLGEPVP
ncbi:MAG TPA: TrmO family methyltransferase, partial [Acidimicrobiia bacterium]|nr:TrmO family methyltransferase [Acidimicrobiia bacterium]